MQTYIRQIRKSLTEIEVESSGTHTEEMDFNKMQREIEEIEFQVQRIKRDIKSLGDL